MAELASASSSTWLPTSPVVLAGCISELTKWISGCDVGVVNLADHGPAAIHLQKIEKVGEAKA